MNLKPIKANMNELETDGIKILFSYQTPVASFQHNALGGFTYFKTSRKWSRATTKHINQWLNGNVAVEKPQEFFDDLVREK